MLVLLNNILYIVFKAYHTCKTIAIRIFNKKTGFFSAHLLVSSYAFSACQKSRSPLIKHESPLMGFLHSIFLSVHVDTAILYCLGEGMGRSHALSIGTDKFPGGTVSKEVLIRRRLISVFPGCHKLQQSAACPLQRRPEEPHHCG